MMEDGRDLMYTTTVAALVLYLLAAADGAALNGLTGSGSHLSDSYVQREPEEERNNLERLTFPPDMDDIKKFAEEGRIEDFGPWNDTKIDIVQIHDYSETSYEYIGSIPVHGIRFCMLLIAFVLSWWRVVKMCKAKKTSKNSQDAKITDDKVKLVV